jgi:hypothetical protein
VSANSKRRKGDHAGTSNPRSSQPGGGLSTDSQLILRFILCGAGGGGVPPQKRSIYILHRSLRELNLLLQQSREKRTPGARFGKEGVLVSHRASWGILPQTPVFSLRSARCHWYS